MARGRRLRGRGREALVGAVDVAGVFAKDARSIDDLLGEILIADDAKLWLELDVGLGPAKRPCKETTISTSRVGAKKRKACAVFADEDAKVLGCRRARGSPECRKEGGLLGRSTKLARSELALETHATHAGAVGVHVFARIDAVGEHLDDASARRVARRRRETELDVLGRHGEAAPDFEVGVAVGAHEEVVAPRRPLNGVGGNRLPGQCARPPRLTRGKREGLCEGSADARHADLDGGGKGHGGWVAAIEERVEQTVAALGLDDTAGGVQRHDVKIVRVLVGECKVGILERPRFLVFLVHGLRPVVREVIGCVIPSVRAVSGPDVSHPRRRELVTLDVAAKARRDVVGVGSMDDAGRARNPVCRRGVPTAHEMRRVVHDGGFRWDWGFHGLGQS